MRMACRHFRQVVRMLWHLHGPNYHVHVLNLGARARFVGCGTSAPVSLDGKLRIYFGKSANPMVLHLSGMCVSHRDTPVPIEDTTSLQPSPSLRPSSPPTRSPAGDTEDGFTKLMCYSLEVNIQAHARVNIHASLYCLVGSRNMFASTPWRNHAG